MNDDPYMAIRELIHEWGLLTSLVTALLAVVAHWKLASFPLAMLLSVSGGTIAATLFLLHRAGIPSPPSAIGFLLITITMSFMVALAIGIPVKWHQLKKDE